MLPSKQGLYSPENEHDNCGAGFICSLQGKKTNDIIHKALDILDCLEHRGAVSADGKTGDGAGILIEIPHEFLKDQCSFNLPEFGEYAVGMVFLPKKDNQRSFCIGVLEAEFKNQGLRVLGWRKVPVRTEIVGKIAAQTEPKIMQIFVGKGDKKLTEQNFKNKLFCARKISEHKIYESNLSQNSFFYVPSLSNRTIIYKGLLIPKDIKGYYSDLSEPKVVTKLALVHQRFSTNTFPTWDLAQPFRYMCHNGEINTYRGNFSRMETREELLNSEFFGEDIKKMLPIILPGKSDSCSMDMAVELLLSTGRSLPEVMMMLVPEAWEKHTYMDDVKKAFYKFNSCLIEPWDGPASIPFTDGKFIGALLDRNGLRPSRYTVTKDGYVVMSSETGVLEIDPANVQMHGRLEPGKMFLVNMDEGRIVKDDEIKKIITSKKPYQKWISDNLILLKDIPYNKNIDITEKESFETRMRIFGYTQEDITTIISPMLVNGKEAIGSMGIDTPLAVLSDKPQLLFNYFKQLFAQVTNPPLDGIREEIVTDISLTLGEEFNLFEISDKHARKLFIENPIISNEDLDKISCLDQNNLKAVKIPILYEVDMGFNGIEISMGEIVNKIDNEITNGANIVILSDRGVSSTLAPIPVLLATSHVHNYFKRHKKRSSFGIIVESAEPREPHHFALLFGYGASAINPYLVNEIIQYQSKSNKLTINADVAIENFNKAIAKGIVKIMNKIGISTLNSYRGAQIFEALGLSQKFIDEFFTNTPTRIEGIGLYEIEKDVSKRHTKAFIHESNLGLPLEIGGEYRWRRDGEAHVVNPSTISTLQQAVRNKSFDKYESFAKLINDQNHKLMTLRGLFEFSNFDPIPINQVEPWTEIVKRFKTGAMSLGSISQEAHENLAVAMNRIGGKSNSGEGGEDVKRFLPDKNGDLKNSAIKQVASGRFGVSSHYLSSAKEIQIKMAQGAKPGEGGQLPGPKVNPYIASVRNSTPYVGLISPPPHHDIYSIEDLSQLIYDLKNANRKARINVKLVSEVGVGTIAAGVAKAKADVILISGYDGGTGASPLTSLRHAGLPWELGIAEAQQTLVLNGLRSRVVLECDGQLKTGRDVAIACLLGAEEFGFSTAPLIASGCIMMRACHLNTCPVGIATQDPDLRKNFKGKPEHVINYMYFVAEELRQIMSELGFRSVDEMVGQSQKLNMNRAINHFKAEGIDLSKILYKPHKNISEDLIERNTELQNHNLENVIDFKILDDAKSAIYNKKSIELNYRIKNTDRTIGAIISNEISNLHGPDGLPKNTLKLNFYGTGGQSFGCFATKGLLMKITGTTNDYFGKGLSGATIIAKVPDEATYKSHENIITGNVALYGATNGEAYVNGIAGERFCVRNSGAKAVVEGIGDHGCEYMTGGVTVILGNFGRNFAAGMSGGIAYIYSESGIFDEKKFNLEMVELEDLNTKDKDEVLSLIENHQKYTNSKIAGQILNDWGKNVKKFIKVMPTDYKRALEILEKSEKENKIS